MIYFIEGCSQEKGSEGSRAGWGRGDARMWPDPMGWEALGHELQFRAGSMVRCRGLAFFCLGPSVISPGLSWDGIAE